MAEMVDVKYITISGSDFIIVDELDYNGKHYMLAIDEEGENTIAVLRQSFVDGKEMVEPVPDEEELKTILERFAKNSDMI